MLASGRLRLMLVGSTFGIDKDLFYSNILYPFLMCVLSESN